MFPDVPDRQVVMCGWLKRTVHCRQAAAALARCDVHARACGCPGWEGDCAAASADCQLACRRLNLLVANLLVANLLVASAACCCGSWTPCCAERRAWAAGRWVGCCRMACHRMHPWLPRIVMCSQLGAGIGHLGVREPSAGTPCSAALPTEALLTPLSCLQQTGSLQPSTPPAPGPATSRWSARGVPPLRASWW